MVLSQVVTVVELDVATKVYQTLGDPDARVPLVLQVGNGSFVAPTVVSLVKEVPQVMSVALAQLSPPAIVMGISELAHKGT